MGKPTDIHLRPGEVVRARQRLDALPGQTALAGTGARDIPPLTLGSPAGPRSGVRLAGDLADSWHAEGSPGSPEVSGRALARPGGASLASVAPTGRAESPVMVAWRLWRSGYATRYRKSYTADPADGNVLKRLIIAAQRQIVLDDRSLSDFEPLLAHWFDGYLRDTGSKSFALKDVGHALRFLERGLPSYGSPWDRELGRAIAEEVKTLLPPKLPSVAATRQQSGAEPGETIEDYAAKARAALANIGKGNRQ